MPHLDLAYPRPDIAVLTLLDAPSLETALHLENCSQMLAAAGEAMGEASEAFRRRPQ